MLLIGNIVLHQSTLLTRDATLIKCPICRYYISYKIMKKNVRQYGEQVDRNKDQRQRILKEFSLMLDREVIIISITPSHQCIG